MSPCIDSTVSNFTDRSLGRLKVVFCFLFLVIITSCGQQKKDPAGYTNAFRPIFEKVAYLFANGKNERAIQYLDSAFHTIDPNLNDRFRMYSFHYVYWQKVKNDNNKALLYADSMLQMANKGINQPQYVYNYFEANFAIADADFIMRRYNEAYRHYFLGYMLGKSNLNTRALADYNYRMGMIMYMQREYRLAMVHFKESYRLNSVTEDKFADFYRRQELLDNIALSFKHSNEPDSAILYFNKTLAYIDQNAAEFNYRLSKLQEARGVVYGNEAEVFMLKKDYDHAIDLLKKSITINLQKGKDNHDAELSEIKLGQIYFEQNKIDSLFSLLKVIHAQLDTVKNDMAEAEWNRLMSRYSYLKNDFKASVNYLRTYNTLRDSDMQKLNLLRESDVNEQLTSYEKQYQIDVLKNNNKVQQIYLYVALIGGIMAVIIIFLVVRNWRRSKYDVQTVNELNKQIIQQKADLEKTLEELKNNSLEKDRILRTVAHDLRNPIGGIASLTGLMEEEEGYTEEQKLLLKLIRDTSQDTILLINEILEVTQNNSTKLNRQLVEINSLLNNSVELLRFKAAEKSQQIMLHTLDAPEEIWISREKIWRVISNLISNAIKFSPYGGIIDVEITSHESDVQISVNDHGIGIPDNIKDKVFNMFTEAKRNGTAGEKSFGLGLSICKQIIEKHQGQLWFESDTVNGTTFYVRLSKTHPDRINPETRQAGLRSKSTSDQKIL